MEFTYNAYLNLIKLLKKNNYNICSYHNYKNFDKCAILRHDVDFNLEKALEFAELENSVNTHSTYFILLSSNIYNIASAKNINIIHTIKELGHEIGLHFDEIKYNHTDKPIPELIKREIKIMSDILDFQIKSVSMHRPSLNTLNANYKIPGVINSYSETFFKEFKYVSDSRCNWKEPILDIIKSKKYKKLHILTHAFWYNEDNLSAAEICGRFVNGANNERYEQMCENIKNFKEFMEMEQVLSSGYNIN